MRALTAPVQGPFWYRRLCCVGELSLLFRLPLHSVQPVCSRTIFPASCYWFWSVVLGQRSHLWDLSVLVTSCPEAVVPFNAAALWAPEAPRR